MVASRKGRTHTSTDGRHCGMHARLHESKYQARKINADMLARIHTSGTARLSAITFTLSNACIHELRLASKRTLAYASIHTRLETRLDAHMRTDMNSLTHTCCELRVFARCHACPHFESHVRFNTSLHACTYSNLNARLHERRFDARRHLRTLAFILNARYYKKELKVYRYTPCRADFTHRVSTNGTNWIGGSVAHRDALDAEARIKIFCSCRGPNLDRPIIQPVVSLYTAWLARHSYAHEIFHATTFTSKHEVSYG
jgi:hypothetical protein